jgi:misacylated tRNA(Ala) deacylase
LTKRFFCPANNESKPQKNGIEEIMTEYLYQVDSYLKTFSAVVTAVDEANRSILLDRTAFYPGGGGQPYDMGWVVSHAVRLPMLRGRKTAEGAWHQLGGESPLPEAGETIQAEIDWSRRYALMRTHTAMHILCGVVFRDYGAQVTGGDMEPLDGRMDFEFETMTRDLVAVIEEAVNREVQEGRPVRTQILPREEAFQIPDLIRTKINLLPPGIEFIRTVEIVGLDLQADGGTHVHNTAEVGRMRIVDYKSKGKINKRIYVRLEE